MVSRAEAVPGTRKWQFPLQDVFGDLRVQYGIKLGLAGVLALYVAELIRLEHPSWAILTVLVMMNVPYVGSITIKAIMRVVGTIAGSLIGIWLVGDYTSTPAIFLPLFFLVVTFAGYKFGQFPASQVPYAYFLVGLTTVSVATYGVTDPADAWQIGLNRTLEILDGAISALLVTTLLWPRYARREFLGAGNDALNTAKKLIAMHLDAFIGHKEVPVEIEQIHDGFGAQLSVLRNLLSAGSRESTGFRTRLSNYNAFLASLTHLFYIAFGLGRAKVETSIRAQMERELDSVAAAFSEEFDILTEPHPPGEKLRSSHLNEAFEVFEAKVSQIRGAGAFMKTPFQTTVAFYRGFAVLGSLRDELNNIRSLSEGLPRVGHHPPVTKPHWDFLPSIDWFWVKMGIKGGLAAAIAILLLNWINPPGPASIPLIAWTLTILGRPFLRAGGSGDLGAFKNGFLASLGLTGCVALLILTTPFLTDYLVMNLALFLILFVYGFMTARIIGATFWMQVINLTISTFVGLNPNEPVPSQTIIDSFLGLIIGMGIAAVVGRLIWPVLPQKVLQDDLLALVAQIKALLSGAPHREKIQTQLALLPVEIRQASRQIRMAGCSEQEKARLGALVRALQTLVTRITMLVSRRHILPEITEAILRPRFERLEVEFRQMLDAFTECFRTGDCRRELPSLHSALGEMDRALEQIRQSELLKDQQLELPVRMLELVDHYYATGEALEECGRLVRALEIQRYWGDYAL